MKITFIPLAESHFPLLLKWLETPHVKKWWPVTPKLGTSEGGDQDVAYTMELVREKYSPRISSLRTKSEAIQRNNDWIASSQAPRNDVIQAFIIYREQNPIGYIQIYNAYDFPRSKPLSGLPENLGAFDIFIGEESALQQGLGSKAILEFLKLHGNQYTHIFAYPDINNLSAIKCYERAGFKKVSEQADTKEVWMIKDNITTIIYLTGKPGVGKYTIAKALAAKYGFIVCDNKLINNPIFELLSYDEYAKIPDFAWDTIARIRAEIFDFLAHHTQNSYVLTNCLEDTEEDKELYEQVKQMAEARGSLFIPVQIQISKEEHLKRLTRLERRQRWKSIDPINAEDNGPLISITHPNLFSLNVSNFSPEDVAEAIMNHINEVKHEQSHPQKSKNC
ncbi:MAG: hypothetical protein RLZZ59_772 [Pseudomonadota bacterium]|jgi:RimJ/RimL family protein N-acetyltransferase/broad-specificity NMP kinase